MSIQSLKIVISKYNLDIALEDLINLHNNHIEIHNFIKKSKSMFEKYSSDSIISKEYLYTYFPKYMKRIRKCTITLDTFELYGLGEAEYKKYCKNKTHNWVKDAKINSIKGVKAAQKDRIENPGKYKGIQSNQLEYWLKKGYSEQEAKQKIKERQSTFSLEKCIHRYGKEKGQEVFNKRQQKWQDTLKAKPQEEIQRINAAKNPMLKLDKESNIKHLIRRARFMLAVRRRANDPEVQAKILNTKIKNGNAIPYQLKQPFNQYTYMVWKVTNTQYIKNLKNFNKRGNIKFDKNAYHLDHKFSIYEGFINNIPPYIIGNINNLEMLPALLNMSKHTKCSISKEELFSKFF